MTGFLQKVSFKRMAYTVDFKGNAVTMTTAEGGFVCKGVSIRRRGTVFGLLARTVLYRIVSIQYSTIQYAAIKKPRLARCG